MPRTEGESPPITKKQKKGTEKLSNIDHCDKSHCRCLLASFVVNHNLPLQLTKELSDLVTQVINELESDRIFNIVANEKRTKLYALSASSLLQENYLSTLVCEPYSIAIDAAISEGDQELLAIDARYFPLSTATATVTKLLTLLPLEGSATGERIFQMIDSFLFKGLVGESRKRIWLESHLMVPPT